MSRLYEELIKSHEDTLNEEKNTLYKSTSDSLADKILKKLESTNESLEEDNQKTSLYDRIMQKLDITEDLNSDEPEYNKFGEEAKNTLKTILTNIKIDSEPINYNTLAIFGDDNDVTVIFYNDKNIGILENGEKEKKLTTISDLMNLINTEINTNLTYNDYKSLSDLYGEGNMEEKLMEEYDKKRNDEVIQTYRRYAGLRDDDVIESLDENALKKASCYQNYDINDLKELLLNK